MERACGIRRGIVVVFDKLVDSLASGEEGAEIGTPVVGRVTRLVGAQKRVLILGECAGTMRQALLASRCQVVVRREAGPTIYRTEGELDSSAGAEERFDVVVSLGALEGAPDPVAHLQRLKDQFRPGGYLVAAVRNATHANVRLALLQGRYAEAAGRGAHGLPRGPRPRFPAELVRGGGVRLRLPGATGRGA